MHGLRGVRGGLPSADQRLRGRPTIDDPPVSESTSPPLPPLQIADLDEAPWCALLDDIESVAELDGVAWKTGPTAYASAPGVSAPDGGSRTKIAAVRAALASAAPLSLQLRYRFDGRRWCDTLMRSGGNVRLVRICENDVGP